MVASLPPVAEAAAIESSDDSRALIPAPREPVPDARPADPAIDPIIADLAQAVAAALVARLAPWLDRIAEVMADLARANRTANAHAGDPVEPPPILLSADAARAYCGGLAKSTWSDFDARGVIPSPVRAGGRVLWRRADLDLWAAKECPGRGRFGVMLEAEARAPMRPNALN